MSNKTLRLTAFVMVAALTVLPGCLRNRTPEERAKKIVEWISGNLELDESQRAKLDSVKDEILTARKETSAERSAQLDEVLRLVKSKEIDPKAIQSLMQQRHERISRIAPGVIARVVEFHASLTDKQKDKIVEKVNDLRAAVTASE